MILLLLGVATGLVLAGLEWRRPLPWRLLRAGLALVAATALGGLAGAPERSRASSADLILVTSAASPASVAEAVRYAPLSPRVTMDQFGTPTALRLRLGDGRLFVVGDGPPPAWWLALSDVPVARLPTDAPLPTGIAALEAATRITAGEPWIVSGIVTGGDAPRVVATGPDGAADTVPVTNGRFTITLRPKAAGAFTWLFTAGPVRAPVSVEVVPRRPQTFLLLAGAPSFELTALKRRLAERGDRVLVRVRTSRARTTAEYVNLPEGPPAPVIDAARLREAGTVILSGRPEDALDDAERAALLRALRAGLGVVRLVRQPADSGTIAALQPAPLRAPTGPAAGLEATTVRVRGFERSAPVPVAAAVFSSEALRVLLRDPSESPLAVVRREGEGRLAGTLITDAARWRTAGDTIAFDAYWRTLLDAVAAPDVETPWQVDGDPRVHVGDEVVLSRFVRDSSGAAPQLRIADAAGQTDTVQAVRGADDPRRLVARWWPRTAGWHAVRATPGASSAPEATADDVRRGTAASGGDSVQLRLQVLGGPADPAQEARARRLAGPQTRTVAANDTVRSIPVTTPWLAPRAWLLLAVGTAVALWGIGRFAGGR